MGGLYRNQAGKKSTSSRPASSSSVNNTAQAEERTEPEPNQNVLQQTRTPRTASVGNKSTVAAKEPPTSSKSKKSERKKWSSSGSGSESDVNEPSSKRLKTKNSKTISEEENNVPAKVKNTSRRPGAQESSDEGENDLPKKSDPKVQRKITRMVVDEVSTGPNKKKGVAKKPTGMGNDEVDDDSKSKSKVTKNKRPKKANDSDSSSTGEDECGWNAGSTSKSNKSAGPKKALPQQQQQSTAKKGSAHPEKDEDGDKENADTSQPLFESSEDERPGMVSSAKTASTITSSIDGYDTGSLSGMSGCSYDPHDPDWIKFNQFVKNSPESAHQHLASELLSSANGSALLGKLIYRCIAEVDENDSDSRKLGDQYGATIIRAILHLTVHNDNASGSVIDLSNMLFTELRHFRTSVLYFIAEYCLKHLKKDKDMDGSLPPRWIEIFGKIIHVMILRGDIKHETDVLKGSDYRQYIVREICGRVNWTSDNAASLIAIIKEIPGINDAELKMTILHIKTFICKVKPGSLPPIVHQLILLAGNRCQMELLELCSAYFSKVDFKSSDSLEVRQKRNALGTVVYHFLETARHNDGLVKTVTKIVKASLFDFGQVMSPFILSVVLGLTTYEYARNLIIEPLRNSVVKTFHSMHLSEQSYWYRHKVGDSEDNVTEAFKRILETKSSELEFMFDGLRELGIGLLNTENKFPNTLNRCQELGSYLITSIVKVCPDKLPSMLNHLVKVCSKSIAHTECLAKCLEMRTRQIIHPSVIGKTCEIIRLLPTMESTSASMLVKALSSAFNLSYILLDQLMIILRKTIWKSVEARRTAAKIMVILLSNSRVVGDIPYSQYSESQRFYMDSQTGQHSVAGSTSQLPDNQPLCMEILTLAKRCFSQQCEVREEMYLGFHSVVRKNPGLCELICMHLYDHTSHYFSDNLELETTEQNMDISSLHLGKIIEWPNANARTLFATPLIKEELGFLVQSLAFVIHKSHVAFHSLDDGPPVAVEKLEEVLQRWIKAVLKLTPDSISIAAADAITGAGGSRPVDTGRYLENIFAIQMMQVIEALIEYLNLENKKRNERTVKQLFEKHRVIEEGILKKEKEKSGNGKGKGKGSKGKAKKDQKAKDNSDEITVLDDTASETSENPGGVKFKKPDAPKKLIYYHIMTLENVLDLLRKLQKADEDRGVTQLVNDNEFEKFLLSVVRQKLSNFKKKEPLRERKRPTNKVAETLADIAGCIWNGLLLHNADGTGNDPSSEMLEMRLGLVSDIVTLICTSHQSVCSHMLNVFTDDNSGYTYDEVFPKLFKSWQTVQGWMPVEEIDHGIHQHLFEILHAFAKPLSPDSNDENRTGVVLTWLWNYMRTSANKEGAAEFLLAEAVVSCWLAYYMKGKDFLEQPGQRQHDVLTLAMGVKQILGVHRDAETQVINDSNRVLMWVINEDTAPTILCAIMNHIEMILDHIMAVLGKLKLNQNDDDAVQNKIGLLRGSCFSKIDEIISVCSELVTSSFPACLCCTIMLKVVPQIFTVMTGFGEYLQELIKAKRPFSLKGFAKPVARIGNEFKPNVESMIGHVELVQREYADSVIKNSLANKKNKGQGGIKVPQAVKNQLLKEKRLIPNFIYVIEKYDQQIIALSKKSTKTKLLVGMKLSTAHDFKIDAKKFSDALDYRSKRVQELTTVPDEESMDALENADASTADEGTSKTARKPAATRIKKNRKRKTPEPDEAEEVDEEEEEQ